MKVDFRYSEFLFLSALASRSNLLQQFNPSDARQPQAVGLDPSMYVEMAAALIEDLYVRFGNDSLQLIVWKLRGEYFRNNALTGYDHEWDNPRATIHKK